MLLVTCGDVSVIVESASYADGVLQFYKDGKCFNLSDAGLKYEDYNDGGIQIRATTPLYLWQLTEDSVFHFAGTEWIKTGLRMKPVGGNYFRDSCGSEIVYLLD